MNSMKSPIILLVLLSFSSAISAEKIFDVKKYGAVSSSTKDINNALQSAWKDACATPGAATVLIPHAVYNLRPIDLAGPCQGSMKFHLKGTLKAPADPKEHAQLDSWIRFIHVDNLVVVGGTVDGLGKLAWTKYNNCKKTKDCKSLPMNIRFDFVNNALLENLTSRDSKNFHINIISVRNFTVNNVKIIAPADSANTDGIHIARSQHVRVYNSTIATGDDCISIGDGSTDIIIQNVTCGPGHGISIGSLGKYKNEQPVSKILVNNCTFHNTENGVRIKTWPGAYQNIVSDVTFKNLITLNVTYPINVDQNYCPWGQCKSQSSSNVKLTGVKIINVKGTAASSTVVKLNCSKRLHCENVELSGIDIKYKGKEGPARAECENVKPKIGGKRTASLNGC